MTRKGSGKFASGVVKKGNSDEDRYGGNGAGDDAGIHRRMLGGD
jgi:hypothetical protein